MDSHNDRQVPLGPPRRALEAGEREAYGTLYESERPWLARFFRKKGLRGADVEDAISDTFAKLVSGKKIDANRLRDQTSRKRLVLKVARFVRADFFRKRKREEPVQSLDAEDCPEIESADDLHATAQLHELEDAVEAELEDVPPQQRIAVKLKLAMHTTKEIAEIVGRAAETARTNLRLGRTALRKRMTTRGFAPDASKASDATPKPEDDE